MILERSDKIICILDDQIKSITKDCASCPEYETDWLHLHENCRLKRELFLAKQKLSKRVQPRNNG
jgi:hypothetical protein